MARETIRIEGLAGVLDTLKRLPPEIVSKAGGPVKLALMKAAEVLRDEAKLNVRRIIDEPNKDEEPRESTGLLLLSIQAKRGRVIGQKGEAQVVSIKRGQKYPDGRQPKKGDLTATQVGRLLEYGSEKMQAKPWLRPAFEAKKQEAVETFTREITKRATATIKRLERAASRK
ncbi:MAG: hypothetical protein M3Q42_10400 [Pseudomonadota bacterium]|nr:hypothetical protein [Pseudomonadota bacterium]